MRASMYGLAVMLLASCGDAEGSFPMDPIASVKADYHADVRGNSSGPFDRMELRARFWWNRESVDLADEERVVVDIDGVQRILAEHHDPEYGLVGYRYDESIRWSVQPRSFRFSLERIEGDAPSSTVSLGDDFAITSPAEASIVSRTDGPIVVTWTPRGVGVSVWWDVTSDCVVAVGPDGGINNGVVVGDPGELTFEMGPFGEDEDVSCEARIYVIRRMVGQVDPALASGSSVTAHIERNVAFYTTP